MIDSVVSQSEVIYFLWSQYQSNYLPGSTVCFEWPIGDHVKISASSKVTLGADHENHFWIILKVTDTRSLMILDQREYIIDSFCRCEYVDDAMMAMIKKWKSYNKL